MELNESHAKPPEEPSRPMPFNIDLNELPLSAGDLSPASPSPVNSAGASRGRAVLLDINAAPPSEAEGDECVQSMSSGMHVVRDTSFIGNPLNEFDLLKTYGSVRHIVRSDFKDSVRQRLNFAGNFTETDLGSKLKGRLWASNATPHKIPFQNPSKVYMQELREFIAENHGILGDGWYVEFNHCQNGSKIFPVYCSPDGKKFCSMFDVACHLGLVVDFHSIESEGTSDRFAFVRKRLHLCRRRESLYYRAKNSRKCQETLRSSCGEFSLGIGTDISQACKLGSNVRSTQAMPEDNGGYSIKQLQGEFPIQFEDFCILSMGEVDPRPTYHNTSQIWPIGYRSSWHDGITGSLFVCDVLDGGDSGPVFKVQRFSCSMQPIPIGSTVIYRQSFDSNNTRSDDSAAFGLIDDEDTDIQMIFLDHCPPQLDHNMLSESGKNSNEVCNFQTMNNLQSESNCLTQSPKKCTVDNSEVIDNIGEFFVEGRSSISVWRRVSQILADACRNMYKQTGLCKFRCKDDFHGMWSSCLLSDSIEASDSLAKFCHLSGPRNIQCCIQSDNELFTTCEALVKWLDQDRFGLDTEFVQEIVEKLPGVDACSEYKCLNERGDISKSHTVGSGFLLVKRKNGIQGEKKADCFLKGCKRSWKQVVEKSVMKDCCPPGKPVSLKLPADSIGDVLQSWELLCRFSEVLELEEPLSFNELEGELVNGYSFVSRRALTKVHCSLLKVLLGELQSKVAAFVDPNSDVAESKLRRGRKKDAENLISVKKTLLDMLPINELTWLELARRYILTVLLIDGNLESSGIIGHESYKVLQCLRGDGGLLGGSIAGVAGREPDALLLAEAKKQIFGSVENVDDGISVDHNKSDASGGCKTPKLNNGEILEWAQALEPVRKLPTNVGARIRKCVYNALEKNPPEWAKKVLEHSICKEVYKGNASGPTKRAVLSLLAEVYGETLQQKPSRKRKSKCVNTLSDAIMKQCRKVLRLAATADKKKVFSSLLAGSLNTSDNDDGGLLQSPRPLDFRTIDMKLTSGVYGGSHDAFLADTREVWHNIRTACGDQAHLIHLAEMLSQKFEILYEKEVLNFVQKFMDNETGGCSSVETKNETGHTNECVREIPKAPSDEDICKLCGVDKDVENVLVCGICDSGYHTYCLNPPLAKIPEENWYCPSCVSGHCITQGSSQHTEVISRCQKKRGQTKFNNRILGTLAHLAATMEMKEYWEYTIEERIILLKFLCDEVLNSAKIREHLEQCTPVSAHLQQRLHSLSSEWRNLMFREDVLAAKVGKENTGMLNCFGKSVTEEVAVVHTNCGKLMGQLLSRSSCISPFSRNIIPMEDGLGWPMPNNSSKQSCWFYSNGSSERHSTTSGNQIVEAVDVECEKTQESFGKNGLISENPLSCMLPSSARDLYSRQNTLPLYVHQQVKDKSSGEDVRRGNFYGQQDLAHGSIDGAMLPYCEHLKGHISSDTINTCVAEQAHDVRMNSGNMFPGYHGIIRPAVNKSQANNLEASFLEKEIAVLQDSIACLESQLQRVSLRKDFLGRDCAGRLYWGFSWPGTSPWVVVDGTMLVQQKKIEEQGTSLPDSSTLRYPSFGTGTILGSERVNISSPYVCKQNDGTSISFSWVSFQSDAEIEELIRWLRDSYPEERELLSSILQWQKIGSKDTTTATNFVQDKGQQIMLRPINSVDSNCLVIRALIILEKKFGACLKSESAIPMKRGWKAEVSFTERMYRCDCLELIWPSRCHCYSCHHSFSTSEELKGHENGMCYSSVPTSVNNKVNDNALKQNGMARTETSQGECSNEIGTSRVAGSAVCEIGFGLNEFPKELACPFDFEEISTKFITKDSTKELVQGIGLIGSNGTPAFVPSTSAYLEDPTLKLEPSSNNEGKRSGDSKNVENQLQQSVEKKMKNGVRQGLRVGNCSIVRESSLRHIMGREVQLLRQLKMNLLDMDAALPQEALKPSRAGLDKRCAWRGFVKSAKSILEMVQATIVLEDMIKTEYLRNGWQYWSPPCAAARIATISSLALRICTLDAALFYEKPLPSTSSTEIEKLDSESDMYSLTCSDPTNTPKTNCKLVQKTCSLDLTESGNRNSKPSKRRKDSGG
ncbi:hypothetical protein FH972_009137 [Carpinus fangiana]|uniref:PHD-type domain-containing protein n=1 Tax=Carpinus fangiana TaxID=176857 RepID=A0A5N6R108_9ROSI|nr:hypothetical protein FH972_009137 [Carpinus fangiana]